MAIALWAIAGYVLLAAVSLALFVAIVVLMPARYFVEDGTGWLARQPPLRRWLAIIGKNLAGLLLIALGVILSLPGIPGQGLLTILIGAMLLDIPGKRRFARWIVHYPRMLHSVNRLRGWFGRPPLIVDKDRRHPD